LNGLGLPKSQEAAETIQRTFIAARAGHHKFQLTLSAVDRDFFAANIQCFPPQKTKPSLQSHRRMLTARRVAAKETNELLEGLGPEEQVVRLESMVQGLADHVWVVNVTVRDEDEAGRVFEILNDRGIELSIADLLRNFLVSREQSNRNDVASKWDALIRDFGGIDLSSFIRHSWMSRYDDVTKKRAYNTIKHEIDARKISSSSYIDQLTGDADIYRQLTDVSKIERRDRELSDLLFGLNVLRAKQALPLLLAVSQCCEPALKRSLSRVNSLTFQYGVLGKNPNDLEEIYSKLARDVRKSNDTDPNAINKLIYDGLKNFASDMDVFAEEFAKYDTERSDLQRYVLWELEKQLGDHEGLEISDPTTTNIEHIYPRSAPEPWEDHDDYLNRLGNLTLLAGKPNREIQNKPFGEKRQTYSTSRFKITSALSDLTKWNQSSIDERQKGFAYTAKEIWRFA
jgi:hypothetical protein